ncbi:MAG: hydroxymethylglutaryl-CoA lyase [Flavobacteriales bacterium]|nr:hydroxymethylglutaryl-CoA lyase [Flavobacteriales bacterium]MCX7767563.1 hydroxymethylglutaryl-CoA lyase [Flavobacteriales bacterium]MDW8410077.1 hydroxymethylglutaryl-CoA lyase [Flavobacteriales bacterium]
MAQNEVFFTECPRDALQGLSHFVDTNTKLQFILALLHCGFDALDFTSFVSPRAVPQMADADALCSQLEKHLPSNRPRLIAIVGNAQGAERAGRYPWIDFLGYPHSVSPTFLRRNINSTPEESLRRLEAIRVIASRQAQQVIVYISMAFGNPYGDPWSAELVCEEVDRLSRNGFSTISLSDTTASGTPEVIAQVFRCVSENVPEIPLGLHLHVKAQTLQPTLEAAWEAGCRRFDGALGGYGGCPLASDRLVGNLPTEAFWEFLESKGLAPFSLLDNPYYKEARQLANAIFS